jgi:ribosomal protein S15P/S13E
MTEKINNIEKHLMENRQDMNARYPLPHSIPYRPGFAAHAREVPPRWDVSAACRPSPLPMLARRYGLQLLHGQRQRMLKYLRRTNFDVSLALSAFPCSHISTHQRAARNTQN